MILRICVCIPCYDNAATIVDVVTQALAQTPFPILVVDDGSQVPVAGLLEQAAESANGLQQGRLQLLRLEKNQGKGRALRAAIAHCVGQGFTHLLTIDADGQHLVREISTLTAVAQENPWALIIGARRLGAPTVPESTRFGRRCSNFWIEYQTGRAVKDSQSGMRLYPLFHLQRMRFRTSRFEWESEVLTRLLLKGVPLVETEMDVHYPPAKQRVTHFRIWIDNIRIVLLDTVFVLRSLVMRHHGPAEAALALGFGALIGSAPLHGWQWTALALAALLLRLNLIYLTGASLLLGSSLSSGSLAGDAAIAAVLAGTGYLIGKAASLLSRRAANWDGRSRGNALWYGFLKRILRHLGLRVGYLFLLLAVPYFYLFASRARRALHEYWAILAPQASFLQRAGHALRHLYTFAQVLMDRALAVEQLMSPAQASPFQANGHGMENMQAALNEDKGLLLLSAHVGGWDLASSALVGTGIGERMHLVQFEAGGVIFRKVALSPHGDPVAASGHLPVDNPIFHLRELLLNKQLVGLMGDRPLSARFELVQFFGHLAAFDVTAFRIARSTGAPIVACFGFKGQGQTYDFYIEPKIDCVGDSNANSALMYRAWAQDFATTLERQLRHYPYQWFNFFPFWSSIPSGPGGEFILDGRNPLEEQLVAQ
ncbi:MAG TPA: glycosyltransferase [Polyangiaceae bacterium]|jgi:predicted LPLAT superfamily acyltransferase|nr:glycosyltransferase [Polyangiaceae bacterium]